MFLLLFSLTVADLPDLPGDDFEVDVPRTPFPTVAPTTPVATQPRKEDFNDITVTSTPNQIQKKLLYTFVALVCVALVGIIATVSFSLSKNVTQEELQQQNLIRRMNQTMLPKQQPKLEILTQQILLTVQFLLEKPLQIQHSIQNQCTQ